jgi:hypothetical protein
VNEVNKGIHVIDNSNPSAPKNISFIKIPGNVDLAVKGNYLYADSYTDLAVFNISDPRSVQAVKFVNAVFPRYGNYYYGNSTNPDSIMVIVDYRAKDTTMECEKYTIWRGGGGVLMDASNNGSVVAFAAVPTGTGGSMARFTIMNNYLYTVSYFDLASFNISAPADPSLSNKIVIGNGRNVETIYPFGDKLFIGTSTGMLIYDVSNPSTPAYVSEFNHVRSCDPVIADGNKAYVTLRSGNNCFTTTNELHILDITNIQTPVLEKSYPMNNPHGLAKDNHLLFICDGAGGVKVYDATSVNNIRLLKTIDVPDSYDVILLNKIALVVAKDGLYQFDYSNPDDIRQLSRLGK